jgi:hypothetical protein
MQISTTSPARSAKPLCVSSTLSCSSQISIYGVPQKQFGQQKWARNYSSLIPREKAAARAFRTISIGLRTEEGCVRSYAESFYSAGLTEGRSGPSPVTTKARMVPYWPIHEIDVVRAEGIEPSRPCGLRIFLPLRLSPTRRGRVRGLDYPFTIPRRI